MAVEEDRGAGRAPAAGEDADRERIRGILAATRTIAVVGISERADRDSHRVAAYLQRAGYRIVPVNPALEEVLGERAWPSLDDVPGPVDLVDVFRRSEEVPAIADAALRKGVRAFWMQLGVRCAATARRLSAAGIEVVEDRCLAVEHHLAR